MIKMENARGEAIVIGLLIGMLLGGIIAAIWLYPPNQNLQNQINQLQQQISSLTNEKIALQNQITTLNNEKQSLQNQIQSLQTQIQNYDIILEGNYINLNNFVKIDPGNFLTLTNIRASWKVMNRAVNTEAWSTYSNGADDFIHQFYFCINQIEAGDNDSREINKLWTLSTNNNNNQLILYAEQLGSNNDEYNLVFHQRDQSNNMFVYRSAITSISLKVNMIYVARIIRSNDLYELQIYNYLHTKIIDSGKLKGLDVDFNKLSLVKTDGYSDDLSDWSTGYIEKLLILK